MRVVGGFIVSDLACEPIPSHPEDDFIVHRLLHRIPGFSSSDLEIDATAGDPIPDELIQRTGRATDMFPKSEGKEEAAMHHCLFEK